MRAGEGGAGGDDGGGGAREDDAAAVVAGVEAEVDALRCSVYRDVVHIPFATHPDDYAATVLACISRGPMFWLWWKTLSGSYLAFTPASRS